MNFAFTSAPIALSAQAIDISNNCFERAPQQVLGPSAAVARIELCFRGHLQITENLFGQLLQRPSQVYDLRKWFIGLVGFSNLDPLQRQPSNTFKGFHGIGIARFLRYQYRTANMILGTFTLSSWFRRLVQGHKPSQVAWFAVVVTAPGAPDMAPVRGHAPSGRSRELGAVQWWTNLVECHTSQGCELLIIVCTTVIISRVDQLLWISSKCWKQVQCCRWASQACKCVSPSS